jgi:hypothetical protein
MSPLLPDSEETLVISEKFATEERRSIGFIRSGEPSEGLPFQSQAAIAGAEAAINLHIPADQNFSP